MDLSKFEPLEVSGLGEAQSVGEIAAELGITICDAHRHLLDSFDGPVLLAENLEICPERSVPQMSEETFSIDFLLGRNSGRYGLVAEFQTYGARLVNWVPIAQAPGGDLLVQERLTGHIFFWQHDADCPEDHLNSYTLVAQSFEDLLARIQLVERPPSKVRAKKVDLRF